MENQGLALEGTNFFSLVTSISSSLVQGGKRRPVKERMLDTWAYMPAVDLSDTVHLWQSEDNLQARFFTPGSLRLNSVHQHIPSPLSYFMALHLAF